MLIAVKVLHAHPTELVLAVVARHVVTSALLHNGNVAFGTRLSVSLHPSIAFLFPSLKFSTNQKSLWSPTPKWTIPIFLLSARAGDALVPR